MGIPNRDQVLETGSSEPPAVRTNGQSPEVPDVAAQGPQLHPSLQIPNLNRTICTRRGQKRIAGTQLAIGDVDEIRHEVGVTLKRMDLLPRCAVRDPHRPSIMHPGDLAAVRAKAYIGGSVH